MSEEEKPEEKRETLEERRKKMEEKMKEMQKKGGPRQRPAQGGLASMMQRMAGAQGGRQDKMMMENMRKLRADMKEIKEYLQKIVDTLEKE